MAKDKTTHPSAPDPVSTFPSWLTPDDLHLFNEGTHYRIYEKLGAHAMTVGQEKGTYFAVWAPYAREVWLIGDFNDWKTQRTPMVPRGQSGIWEAFVPEVGAGNLYKYHVVASNSDFQIDKSDPVGFFFEHAPQTGSVVWPLDYRWADADWMKERAAYKVSETAMSIYEVHLGSWMRIPEEDNRKLTYRELAPKLTEYVKRMGFTHIEIMPVMEHPFYASWGYLLTGWYAPTSRYGSPQDFMFLVDTLHQSGIGVILDWVPSHFPCDGHGLGYFDGTHLYEHADPRQGFHPDWQSFIFNYGRPEVRSFLISNAFFWLDKFHVDGLRVDAVASMLYLDYSRKNGQWVANSKGGRENLEAIDFLRQLNTAVHKSFPDALMIAEESTAWAKVSSPVEDGGLGFALKWDMGWMHDTLQYMAKDPWVRRYHHGSLSFRMVYAFSENFILSLSHDEVVHMKGSLLRKMPGDEWQRFANLRLLFTYMYAMPGKKLLFMGDELAQWTEWNHDTSLDWHLTNDPRHAGVQRLVRDLNHFYREQHALHDLDFSPEGFEWIDHHDHDASILSFLRRSAKGDETLLAVFNFTPVPRHGYLVGVPFGGKWKEVFNSDANDYHGGGMGNLGEVAAKKVKAPSGQPWSLPLALPPLTGIFLRSEGRSG